MSAAFGKDDGDDAHRIPNARTGRRASLLASAVPADTRRDDPLDQVEVIDYYLVALT